MSENQNTQHHGKQNENGGANGHENANENNKDHEPVIPEEFLNELPPKDRKEFIQSFTRISGIFPPQNPLAKKITSDHISELLKISDASDQRDRQERSNERNHNFKVLVTVLVAIFLVCGLFIWAKQEEFLKYIIGAIIGFGGGFGVGKYYKKE
jgi:hypothetical protein